MNKLFKEIGKFFVYFYIYCISPFLPHACKYTPTCSKYMLQSIERFGLSRGIFMGLGRIFRCNPWSKGGKDVVKQNLKGEYKWVM